MDMERDNVSIYCLPDNAHCEADGEMRNPVDIDECPMGYDKCDGDCFYYVEG